MLMNYNENDFNANEIFSCVSLHRNSCSYFIGGLVFFLLLLVVSLVLVVFCLFGYLLVY